MILLCYRGNSKKKIEDYSGGSISAFFFSSVAPTVHSTEAEKTGHPVNGGCLSDTTGAGGMGRWGLQGNGTCAASMPPFQRAGSI